MPTVNYFPDPRLQAVADYMSVLQYQRLQSEIRNQEREAKQRQMTGMIAGGVLGGLGGALLGPAVGATALAGGVQGAGLGLQAGAQFGGGDIAGGAATVAGGVGDVLQAHQEFQRYGFRPTPLDKAEISKLATSLGTTTRAITAGAKQADVSPGQFAAQLAQQQAAQVEQDAFIRQAAQQYSVPPEEVRDVYKQTGGIEPIRQARQEQQQAQKIQQFDQRMARTAVFEGKLKTHDIVQNDEPAEQALRYRNTILSPAAGLDQQQQLQLLERVVTDAEKQQPEYKWVQKPPPNPMDVALAGIEKLGPVIEQMAGLGLANYTLSFDKDGNPRIAFSQDADRDSNVSLPDGGQMSRRAIGQLWQELYTTSKSADVKDVMTEGEHRKNATTAVVAAMRATIDAPGMVQQQIEEEARLAAVGRQMPDITAAVTKLEAAVERSPNIENWAPGQIAAHLREAEQVFDFYVDLKQQKRAEGEDLNQAQERRLAVAKEIIRISEQ